MSRWPRLSESSLSAAASMLTSPEAGLYRELALVEPDRLVRAARLVVLAYELAETGRTLSDEPPE
jgi:hypothetical protein